MESLAVGLSMGRLPIRPNSSSQSSRSLHRHRRLSLDDQLVSGYELRRRFSNSLSWLPSARRQRSLDRMVTPSSAEFETENSSLKSKSRVASISCNDAVVKPLLNGISQTTSRLSQAQCLPSKSHRTKRARARVHHTNTSENEEPWNRSFSPFSDSALAIMADGHLERRAVDTYHEHPECVARVQDISTEKEDVHDAMEEKYSDPSLTSWLLDLPETPVRSSATESVDSDVDATVRETIRHGQEQQDSSTASPSLDKPLPPKPLFKHKAAQSSTTTPFEPPQRPSKLGRWNVPGSVASILSRHPFNSFRRVEADEMLTPERMRQLKAHRLKMQTKSDRQPAKPSEPQRLPSQPAASVAATLHRSENDVVQKLVPQGSVYHTNTHIVGAISGHSPSTEPIFNAAVQQDVSVPKSSFNTDCPSKSMDQKEETQESKDAPVTNPPPSKSATRPVYKQNIDRLPTIPEVVALGSDECSSGRSSEDQSIQSVESGEYVYFLGTILSTANLSFRHGRIACHRPEPEDVATSPVDWCAFQMAILGGAGDLMTDMGEDDESQIANEMSDWFETFGFETHGELISDGSSSLKCDRYRHKLSSSLHNTKSNPDLLIPGHGDETHKRSRSEPIRFFRGDNKEKRLLDARAKRYSLRDSNGRAVRVRANPLIVGDSQMSGQVSEETAEAMQLSCSMTQDLREFLQWEAEQIHGDVI